MHVEIAAVEFELRSVEWCLMQPRAWVKQEMSILDVDALEHQPSDWKLTIRKTETE